MIYSRACAATCMRSYGKDRLDRNLKTSRTSVTCLCLHSWKEVLLSMERNIWSIRVLYLSKGKSMGERGEEPAVVVHFYTIGDNLLDLDSKLFQNMVTKEMGVSYDNFFVHHRSNVDLLVLRSLTIQFLLEIV